MRMMQLAGQSLSLSEADIAGAVVQSRAVVVAISIVYPKDDPNLPNELISLRPFPTEVRILIGGGGAAAYGDSLMRIAILQPHNLDAFSLPLDDLRELRPSDPPTRKRQKY
jgi:hypothetical protein